MAALFFPCALIGVFVCFIQEIFFTTKFYSSIVDEKSSNTGKSEDFKNFEFTLLTNNTCLMPEFLSRKNNQPFAIKRAGRIAQSLITKPEKAPTQNIDVNLPEIIGNFLKYFVTIKRLKVKHKLDSMTTICLFLIIFFSFHEENFRQRLFFLKKKNFGLIFKNERAVFYLLISKIPL